MSKGWVDKFLDVRRSMYGGVALVTDAETTLMCDAVCELK
jgi:hypothetical protein